EAGFHGLERCIKLCVESCHQACSLLPSRFFRRAANASNSSGLPISETRSFSASVFVSSKSFTKVPRRARLVQRSRSSRLSRRSPAHVETAGARNERDAHRSKGTQRSRG